MSGAELIAVLSVGASVIQVVDASNKLIDRIKEYRSNAAFVKLRSQLRLLARNVQSLDRADRHGDSSDEETELLAEVLQGCKLQIEELNELLTSLLPKPDSSALRKTAQAVRAFLNDHRVQRALTELEKYGQVILFHLCRQTEQNTRQMLSLMEQDRRTRIQAVSVVVDEHLPDSSVEPRPKLNLPTRGTRAWKTRCQAGLCGCSCHRPSYTRLGAVLFSNPWTSTKRCQCAQVNQSVGIAAFQKLFLLDLAASWSNGLSLNVSLKAKRIIDRYNYPGFDILELCSLNLMSLEETTGALIALQNSGHIDFEDADENSNGFLENLLGKWWKPDSQELLVGLAKFLVDQGVTWKRNDSKQIRSTVGVSTRTHQVTELIECLPPFEITYSSGLSWSDDRARFSSSDAFNLEAFRQIIICGIDLGECTKLHCAVSQKCFRTVQALVERKRPLVLERNFFGHTVLHLAVQLPQILQYLISNGYGNHLDIHDFLGISPIVYAVVYNNIESVKILIQSGANMNAETPLNCICRDPWAWALSLPDEQVFSEMFSFYRSVAGVQAANDVAGHCIRIDYHHLWKSALTYGSQRNIKALSYLIEAGYDIVAPTLKGNTPLHTVTSVEEARFWIETAPHWLNHPNEDGYTALMIFSRMGDPILVREAIARGALPNHLDSQLHSPLHHTLDVLHKYPWRPIPDSFQHFLDVLGVVRNLVTAGGNILTRDSCRCYCTPSGCTPLHFATVMNPENSRQRFKWLVANLELFLTVKRAQNTEQTTQFVHDFARLQSFDELGMTHTCCAWHRQWGRYCYVLMFHKPPSLESPDYSKEEIAEKFQPDMQEIRDEERELAAQLDEHLKVQPRHGNPEKDLVTVLARRSVMMEDVGTRYWRRNVRGSHDLTPGQEAICIRKLKERGNIHVISVTTMIHDIRRNVLSFSQEDPLVYRGPQLDNSSFREVNFGIPDELLDELLGEEQRVKSELDVIEPHIQSYLEIAQSLPNHLDQAGPGHNHDELMAERKRLADMLVAEVERVRSLPVEEKDWDIESWVDGIYIL